MKPKLVLHQLAHFVSNYNVNHGDNGLVDYRSVERADHFQREFTAIRVYF
jgi:hypothetical protein